MSRILVKTRIPEMSEATLEVVMGAEVVQVVHVVNVLIGTSNFYFKISPLLVIIN